MSIKNNQLHLTQARSGKLELASTNLTAGNNYSINCNNRNVIFDGSNGLYTVGLVFNSDKSLTTTAGGGFDNLKIVNNGANHATDLTALSGTNITVQTNSPSLLGPNVSGIFTVLTSPNLTYLEVNTVTNTIICNDIPTLTTFTFNNTISNCYTLSCINANLNQTSVDSLLTAINAAGNTGVVIDISNTGAPYSASPTLDNGEHGSTSFIITADVASWSFPVAFRPRGSNYYFYFVTVDTAMGYDPFLDGVGIQISVYSGNSISDVVSTIVDFLASGSYGFTATNDMSGNFTVVNNAAGPTTTPAETASGNINVNVYTEGTLTYNTAVNGIIGRGGTVITN